MIRKIITIDKDRCNGCGLCVSACHEGAIGLEEGKAVLLRDDYCDGLGDCLPACPMDAISFEEREALAYDEEAVKENMKKKALLKAAQAPEENVKISSKLTNFPVQIKLVSPDAYFLDGCDLLVAADCTAFAYGNFHNDFMKDKVTIIGCTKLDKEDYSEKFAEIFRGKNINSVTVARMQVPCCGGMENAVKEGLDKAGKTLPLRVVTISSSGAVIKDVNY